MNQSNFYVAVTNNEQPGAKVNFYQMKCDVTQTFKLAPEKRLTQIVAWDVANPWQGLRYRQHKLVNGSSREKRKLLLSAVTRPKRQSAT